MAIVDPRVVETMPMTVAASSGFDVLCHAIESYTARPFTKRPPAEPKHIRPLNQGLIIIIRIRISYFDNNIEF